jgi:hypothetical protein
MHRHWSTRAFTAFILAWFLAVATELPLLHSCEVHGSATASAASEPHGAAHHSGLHSDSPTPDADRATCSCMGDCSAGGFSLDLSSPEHRVAVAFARDAGVTPLDTGAARTPAPPFLLPYANGPPGTSALA